MCHCLNLSFLLEQQHFRLIITKPVAVLRTMSDTDQAVGLRGLKFRIKKVKILQ